MLLHRHSFIMYCCTHLSKDLHFSELFILLLFHLAVSIALFHNMEGSLPLSWWTLGHGYLIIVPCLLHCPRSSWWDLYGHKFYLYKPLLLSLFGSRRSFFFLGFSFSTHLLVYFWWLSFSRRLLPFHYLCEGGFYLCHFLHSWSPPLHIYLYVCCFWSCLLVFWSILFYFLCWLEHRCLLVLVLGCHPILLIVLMLYWGSLFHGGGYFHSLGLCWWQKPLPFCWSIVYWWLFLFWTPLLLFV